MEILVVFSNKFDYYYFNIILKIMDFFKALLELNTQIEIKKLADKYYEIDSDDDEEDIEYITTEKNNLIINYNKKNSRLFKLTKNG